MIVVPAMIWGNPSEDGNPKLELVVEQHGTTVTMRFECDAAPSADAVYDMLERQLALGEFNFRVRRRANDDGPVA